MSNILEVTFESGQTFATAERLWKGDYGQVLLIHGPELPAYYEVHFSSTKDGTPEVSVGTPEGVNIPNRLLQAEGHIYAWVFLHAGQNDGETKYQVKIPVEERGIPIDQETPEDRTAVQEAIDALNAETGRAEAAADAASVSELNAKASEEAARESEQNAETAAQAAAASAENAALSEDGAAESEAAAAISAREAAASAAAAAASAAEAGGSEETVAEYARQAEQAADAAIQYGVLAVQSAQDAEASAQTAETYGEAAIEAKTTATSAAATATQKAQEASTNAGIAASHAATAVSKATEAVQSANDAAQSADDAADSAEDADDSAASARLHDEQAQAAKVDAQTAAGNASAAQTAAEAAQTAAETAQGKAEDAQDAAEAAQSSAEAAQTAAETAQGLAEAAQTAAEAAQELAEDAQAAAESAAETLSGSIDQVAQNTDDIADLQAEVLNMYPVDTADGPVASFPDGADDIPLKSLIVDINPVQDLHGYDSPWPAGGGKNKFHFSAGRTAYTWSDGFGFAAISVDDDGITFNGTSTSAHPFSVTGAEIVLPAGTYRMSTESRDVGVSLLENGEAITTNYGTTGSAFTLDHEATLTIIVTVGNGASFSNKFIGIQLEAGSTPTAWTPYENLCPISGWDKVELNHAGKNLLDTSKGYTGVGYNVADGTAITLTENGNYTISGNKILFTASGWSHRDFLTPPLKDGIYHVTIDATKVTSPRITLYTIDAEGKIVSHNNYTSAFVISVNRHPLNGYRILVSIGTSTAQELEFADVQVESGNASTPWKAPNIRPIIIQLGDTYYGAQLDVLNGVLRVNTKAVDMGVDLGWVAATAGGVRIFYSELSSIGSKVASTFYALCSCYKRKETVPYVDGCFIAYGASNFSRVAVRDDACAEMTAAEYRQHVIGQTLVFELETPIEIQLTPEQVNSFLGTNNIWADTGDTHAIYRADIGLYIQKLTGSTEEDMTANVNIASGKYFLVGNTLYLSTSAIAAGEQIVPGTNCTLTNLAAALNALNS